MEHEGMGGSYVRQKDGSLKLVSRTEERKPAEKPAETETAPAGAGKKDR